MSEFRERLCILGLSGRAFADLTGLHEETVNGWGKSRSGRGVQEVPRWALLLLHAWICHPETMGRAS